MLSLNIETWVAFPPSPPLRGRLSCFGRLVTLKMPAQPGANERLTAVPNGEAEQQGYVANRSERVYMALRGSEPVHATFVSAATRPKCYVAKSRGAHDSRCAGRRAIQRTRVGPVDAERQLVREENAGRKMSAARHGHASLP
jgi:hypothetical protein